MTLEVTVCQDLDEGAVLDEPVHPRESWIAEILICDAQNQLAHQLRIGIEGVLSSVSLVQDE
jgi:hypothetical protein